MSALSPGLLIVLASPDGLELEPALYLIPTLLGDLGGPPPATGRKILLPLIFLYDFKVKYIRHEQAVGLKTPTFLSALRPRVLYQGHPQLKTPFPNKKFPHFFVGLNVQKACRP